ncbi:nuclear transport factor 2 family protein [Pengzhenrongella phosphoraccumulans]|uniref:nuclear transport factor 2 family protein n=1 Tax=Pengzhenrongella phosphoraccumulans TaxID=3114394 RepID=UPI00388D63DE
MTAALETALAYHRAWTSGDPELAWRLLADGVECLAPTGRLVGVEAVKGFMGPFATNVTTSELLSAYGDEHEALLMYDTGNPAVASAPAAELYTVRDGRIVAIRIIFDRLPFALARGEVQTVNR